MLNLIQRFFSREQRDRAEIRRNFDQFFFSQPEHQWMVKLGAQVHFERLFTLLPTSLLEAFMTKWPLSFVPSDALDMNRPGAVLSNTIVVFPEFQRLLASGKGSAVAYLAHELALLVLELEGASGESVMAQVEADKFVADLGLTFELEEFLLLLDESVEKRLRLTYLTINHFKSGAN